MAQEQKHTADQAEMVRELAEAKANEIYSSQLMRRFRDTLSNIRDGLEDEGDRIYLGSTNDADELHEIAQAIEELEWDRILASSQKKPDLYARIRELNTEVRAARALQKELLVALQEVLGGLEILSRADPKHKGIKQDIATARTAIAKAGGKS